MIQLAATPLDPTEKYPGTHSVRMPNSLVIYPYLGCFMSPTIIFVNRRKGADRREDADPCKDMSLDLFHRKRRKSKERRDTSRNLTDDYYAFMQKTLDALQQSASSDQHKR